MSHTNKPPNMGGAIQCTGTTQQLNRTETPVTPAKPNSGATGEEDVTKGSIPITVQTQAVQTKVIYWVGGKPNAS